MTKHKKLTPVEWEIMEAIWFIGDSPSVRDVLEHAFPDGQKAYTTVQTIIKTLEKKGFLTSQKIGLVNFYTPTKTRDDMVKSEMSNMVSRVFNGSVPALASYLFNSDDLTLEEIDLIKKTLNQKEAELKGD